MGWHIWDNHSGWHRHLGYHAPAGVLANERVAILPWQLEDFLRQCPPPSKSRFFQGPVHQHVTDGVARESCRQMFQGVAADHAA